MLNTRGVGVAKRTEMHAAGSVALEPSAFVTQMCFEKIKIYEFPCIGEIICSEIHKLTVGK